MVFEFASNILARRRSQKIMPIDEADTFFGMPDLFNQIEESFYPTHCAHGCLALRVPDPPTYAPPAIVNISKDGKIAAVGGKDVELFLWSTETGELLSTLRGHETSWTGSNDNSFFVTTQEDSEVLVWDQQKIQQRMLLGHPDELLTCCSISLDDKYVIVGGLEGSIYSWDVSTGAENNEYYGGHAGPVATAMCFLMPDDSHIIISCGKEDRRIVVWDLTTVKQLYTLEVDELKDAKNFGYHISKEQIQVLMWCTDTVPFPNLVFMDPLSGSRNSVLCHGGDLKQATFMKQATRIVTAGGDGKAVIWDTSSMEARLTLEGHKGAVLSCGVNEEGTFIVTGGEDCTVRVWNAEDGRQIRMMLAQNDPIRFCQYAKSALETKIITCDVAGRVHVWSTVVEVLNSLLRRFADELTCVTVSSDNELIAAGCNNGHVMLWNTKTRTNTWEYTHHTGRVEGIAFNTLRELLATGGNDGRVVLMSVKTGKQLSLFIASSEPVCQVCFSPDDDRIFGVTEGKVTVFKVDQTDYDPYLTLGTGAGRVVACSWSPNSKSIIGCLSDGNVMVWSATTGSVFAALNGDAATSCLSIDLVGKVLAVGNVLGRTIIYILETSEQLCELRSNASAVREVIFNTDTTRLTTICSRQAITWDLARAAQLRVFDFVVDKGHSFFHSVPDRVRAAYCHWGNILFDHESETATFDMVPFEDPMLRSPYLSDLRGIISGNTGIRRIILWSGADNPMPEKLHTAHDAITSCHFSPNDRLLAVGTQDGSLVIYDAHNNDTLEVIPAHINGPCKCVRMSHDGRFVLTSGADGQVVLWDWRDKEAVKRYLGHIASVECCDLALHGARVASGDSEGMVCVFNRETAEAVLILKDVHPLGVTSLSISADGSTVVTIGKEGKVSMWHVDMGTEIMALETAMLSKPLFCCFSLDDCKLAITESNGTVMVWNVVAGCQWYLIPNAHGGATIACAWSFNCRHLVTAGMDGSIALWDAESGAPLLKMPVKTGPLTTCSISPSSLYVATGSVSGTLTINNIASLIKLMPEPSFLYSWLDFYEHEDMVLLLKKLFRMWPYLYNIQDAQGWSLVSNAVGNGNAKVTSIVTEALESVLEPSVGLVGAVPSTQLARVVLDRLDEDYVEGDGYNAKRVIPNMAQQIVMAHAGELSTSTHMEAPLMGAYANSSAADGASPNTKQGGKRGKHSAVEAAAKRSKRRNKQRNKVIPIDDASERAMDINAAVQRAKSFNVQAKKATIEVLLEKRRLDSTELTLNNVLAMALNSKSSKCVQMVLDITSANKVSWGSFHAITDMMPALAKRYPYTCFRFLADLDLHTLGSLEIPVTSLRDTDSLLRTSPLFTNIQDLWSSHTSQQHHGPQPYAHMKANMVRLPFACAIGPESLLHSLVESDVPVQAFGAPSVHTVICHKWHLYGRTRIVLRAVIYLVYTLALTVFAILFSKEDHSLSLPDYWLSGPQGRYHIISTGYLTLQALWYLYVEARQVLAIGVEIYFRSGWNTLDIVSMLMMVAIGALQLSRTGTEPDRQDRAVAPMIAFTLILTYFKLFFYALAFEPTGPVVHMLFQVSLAVRNWAILLFMNIVSFGTALQVLAQFTTADDQYSNFGMSLLTLWQSMFRQLHLEGMRSSGAWPVVSIVIFCLWLFISNIVLLNMLIVMMREMYRNIRNLERDVFLRGRAQLIVEVETLLSGREREKYALMPPYLHKLDQVQRNLHSTRSLLGRLGMMEEFVSAMHSTLVELMLEIGRRQGGSFGLRRSKTKAPTSALQLPAPPKDSKAGGGAEGGGSGGGGGGVTLSMKEHLDLLRVMLQHMQEMDSLLPAVQRQVDRLQRSVNDQDVRIESMVNVLRNLEDLLRNQQPTTVPAVVAPPRPVRRPVAMSEAELEREVKKLLVGDAPGALAATVPAPPQLTASTEAKPNPEVAPATSAPTPVAAAASQSPAVPAAAVLAAAPATSQSPAAAPAAPAAAVPAAAAATRQSPAPAPAAPAGASASGQSPASASAPATPAATTAMEQRASAAATAPKQSPAAADPDATAAPATPAAAAASQHGSAAADSAAAVVSSPEAESHGATAAPESAPTQAARTAVSSSAEAGPRGGLAAAGGSIDSVLPTAISSSQQPGGVREAQSGEPVQGQGQGTQGDRQQQPAGKAMPAAALPLIPEAYAMELGEQQINP